MIKKKLLNCIKVVKSCIIIISLLKNDVGFLGGLLPIGSVYLNGTFVIALFFKTKMPLRPQTARNRSLYVCTFFFLILLKEYVCTFYFGFEFSFVTQF
jgi:hypothetical protein